jgi:hypothetical protein
MSYTEIAKELGRRGGLKRAKRLSKDRRQEIARLGAKARVESLRLAKAIQSNFDYLAAIQELSPPSQVESHSDLDDKLPGIYPK